MPADRPMVLHTRVVSGTGGGPDKTILNSARHLVPFGYDCLSAYMHPPDDPGFGELQRRAERADAPLVGIEDRGPLDLRVVRRMRELCREHNVTIWHGHDYKSNALGLVIRRSWPMRLVSTVHGWGVQGGRRALYYKIDRLCLRRYERVVCVSQSLLDVCTTSGVPAERCQVIENAVDTDEYRRGEPPAEAKRRLGFQPERLLVGSVGRLSDEKCFPALVGAVGGLVREGLDVELVIVGEGDQRGPIEAAVAELGLGDRVHLPGYLPDAIDHYQAMDAFVLNSLREGLPNVVLEAMAMEVPVVSTRVAGVPRLIEHETSGLLIDPDDAEGLAAALGRLLRDAGLRQRMAEAGRRTIQERYSFAVRMEKMRAVYDELLEEDRRE